MRNGCEIDLSVLEAAILSVLQAAIARGARCLEYLSENGALG